MGSMAWPHQRRARQSDGLKPTTPSTKSTQPSAMAAPIAEVAADAVTAATKPAKAKDADKARLKSNLSKSRKSGKTIGGNQRLKISVVMTAAAAL